MSIFCPILFHAMFSALVPSLWAKMFPLSTAELTESFRTTSCKGTSSFASVFWGVVVGNRRANCKCWTSETPNPPQAVTKIGRPSPAFTGFPGLSREINSHNIEALDQKLLWKVVQLPGGGLQAERDFVGPTTTEARPQWKTSTRGQPLCVPALPVWTTCSWHQHVQIVQLLKRNFMGPLGVLRQVTGCRWNEKCPIEMSILGCHPSHFLLDLWP